jgi:transposase
VARGHRQSRVITLRQQSRIQTREPVVNTSITHVAMDTHKKEHTVAVGYPGQDKPEILTVANTVLEIRRMVRRILKQAPGEVVFCYEAGCCGFALQRRIDSYGGHCQVIAPSLVPVKRGEHVKTDRRDAIKLLKLFRAGLLTVVEAPDPQQEADRDLTRLRQTARENLQRVRHQILKLLGRHGYVYTDGAHWTVRHRNWMRTLEWDSLLLREVFDEYSTELQHCLQRLESLDRRVLALAQEDRYRETVGLLGCFYGIDTMTAIVFLTELFDLTRFASPRQLMSYLGMTPSEESSGDCHYKGPITKSGNGRIRRLLVQAAWHYRHPQATTPKTLRDRRKDQPQWAINLAERAGHRLRKRYWHLLNKGKPPCKVVVAVARELAGFLWAMLREQRLHRTPRTIE